MKKYKKLIALFLFFVNILFTCFYSSVIANYDDILDEYNVSFEEFERQNANNSDIDFINRIVEGIGIPQSFDLRKSNPNNLAQHGDITINVENQGKEGLCWAFSALGALRTHLAVKGIQVDPNVDSKTTANFSEWHMNYLTSKYYPEKFNSTRDVDKADVDSKVSGNFTYALNYFKCNDGPILESELPLGSYN